MGAETPLGPKIIRQAEQAIGIGAETHRARGLQNVKQFDENDKMEPIFNSI
jgi:hypothetical protein